MAVVIIAAVGGCMMPVEGVDQDLAVTEQAVVAGDVVISQIFGGGGSAGAAFDVDFIELFNRSHAPASLSGLYIQYASVNGNFAAGTALPSVVLAPGQYFLIQTQSGSHTTFNPPDVTWTAPPLAAASAKIALTNTATRLGCGASTTPCQAAAIYSKVIDLVGYGVANFAESGGAAAPVLSKTTAGRRKSNGCQDTNNNSQDFVAGPATDAQVRNSASPLNVCP